MNQAITWYCVSYAESNLMVVLCFLTDKHTLFALLPDCKMEKSWAQASCKACSHKGGIDHTHSLFTFMYTLTLQQIVLSLSRSSFWFESNQTKPGHIILFRFVLVSFESPNWNLNYVSKTLTVVFKWTIKELIGFCSQEVPKQKMVTVISVCSGKVLKPWIEIEICLENLNQGY